MRTWHSTPQGAVGTHVQHTGDARSREAKRLALVGHHATPTNLLW
jgi:hypothetical protein